MKLVRGHTEGCRVSHWWHGNANTVFSVCGRTWNHGKPLKGGRDCKECLSIAAEIVKDIEQLTGEK